MFRIFLGIILTLIFSCTSVTSAQSSQKLLPPEQAFAFSAPVVKGDQLLLEWHIAPGYHLYRDHLKITVAPDSDVQIGTIKMPEGKTEKDDVLGIYQVYVGTLKIAVPLISSASQATLKLNVDFQGCSEKGYCFPPIKKDLQLTVPQTEKIVVTNDLKPNVSDQNYATSLLQGRSNFFIILSFLGLGLLLAFTPCVLPMIPILSGIIVGHGKNLTTAKAFLLSFVYVIGMAVTYAIAGMVVAMIGSRIQTLFQTTWAIVIVSGLFVLLSLSLFGFYELEGPKNLRNLFTSWSNKQQGGTYVGVFLMGVLSSLIVSPCVSAPLVGVLAYIAQTGNVILGGFALLSLGFGMGIPLLLVGISAGKLLPKAGAWMESVKKLFGIIMLGVAIWMLSRVIPGQVTLFLWAMLLICSAMYVGPFTDTRHKLLRGLAIVMLIYGVVLVSGAAMGNSDPLRPWERLGGVENALQKKIPFIVVKNMEQLDSQLVSAKHDNRPVIVDFYADWCMSCVKIDHHVFAEPQVQAALGNFVLIRADVTQNNDFDKALLKRFNVVAPPTILFFSRGGDELAEHRIVGEISESEFLQRKKKFDLAQS